MASSISTSKASIHLFGYQTACLHTKSEQVASTNRSGFEPAVSHFGFYTSFAVVSLCVHPTQSSYVVMNQYAEDWVHSLKTDPTPICHGPHDYVRRQSARSDLASDVFNGTLDAVPAGHIEDKRNDLTPRRANLVCRSVDAGTFFQDLIPVLTTPTSDRH